MKGLNESKSDQIRDKTHSKHTQTVCCLPARARVNSKEEGEREQPEEKKIKEYINLSIYTMQCAFLLNGVTLYSVCASVLMLCQYRVHFGT